MSLPNNKYFASPMQHLTHEPCSPTHPGWEASERINIDRFFTATAAHQMNPNSQIQPSNCLWLRLKDLFIPNYISLGKQLHIYTSKVNKPCNLYRSHLPGLVDVRSSRQEGQVATRIFWCPTPVMFKKMYLGCVILIFMYHLQRCTKFPANIK